MKLRSINDAFETIKADDPETAMTLSGLRRLVGIGEISSIRIGRRILIDYDNLTNYLCNPPVENITNDNYGKVRKV